MFTFDDSPLPGTAGQNEFPASGSPTPIFDRLFEEWQRMFRAVPGDRYGEGFPAGSGMHAAMQHPGAQSGMPSSMQSGMQPGMQHSGVHTGMQSAVQGFSSGSYPVVPSSLPVPAFRAEQGPGLNQSLGQGLNQGLGQGPGYPQPYGSSAGFAIVAHSTGLNGGVNSGPDTGPNSPHISGSSAQSAAPVSGSAMNTPPPMHAQGAYESYGQSSRPAPMPNRQPSGLALMPVAGYQTVQHMPL